MQDKKNDNEVAKNDVGTPKTLDNDASAKQRGGRETVDGGGRCDAAKKGKQTVVEGVVDDDVATAEEVAEETRRSAEKRARKRAENKVDDKESEFAEYVSPDSLIDPYLDPDPVIPWEPFAESPFLSRGCRKCPEAYSPVGDSETRMCGKMTACNWLAGVRQPSEGAFDIVEVRFKNNRKDFFRLPDGLEVEQGDVVAVEGAPGHDIGIVSLVGEVCKIQMKKKHVNSNSEDIKKLFRRAKAADIEKWAEGLAEEHKAMLRTRQIVEEQGLVMKVDDVEFQGDRSKAIFYYTADDRVDFRNLIKVLADEFKVRIEMKQIGVRQEAGRVGGLGTCGRELCCSTWLTNFKSVTTGAAKAQQIHPNPQKLAGQCGKLKCCLNFEYEVYADALKQFPPAGTAIRFQKGLALYKKTDVLRGIMWYAYEGENDLHAIPAESVKKVIEMNKNQQYPSQIEDFQVELVSNAALQQESNAADFERELQRLASKEQTEPDSGGRGDGGKERRQRQEQDGKGRRRDGGKPQQANRPEQQKGGPEASSHGASVSGEMRERRSGQKNRKGNSHPRN